jgi:hypothetical protein
MRELVSLLQLPAHRLGTAPGAPKVKNLEELSLPEKQSGAFGVYSSRHDARSTFGLGSTIVEQVL